MLILSDINNNKKFKIIGRFKYYFSMEAFIASVRAEPCLWNPLHPEYREVGVRDAAWQRIVTQCNNDSIPNGKWIRFHIVVKI